MESFCMAPVAFSISLGDGVDEKLCRGDMGAPKV